MTVLACDCLHFSGGGRHGLLVSPGSAIASARQPPRGDASQSDQAAHYHPSGVIAPERVTREKPAAAAIASNREAPDSESYPKGAEHGCDLEIRFQPWLSDIHRLMVSGYFACSHRRNPQARWALPVRCAEALIFHRDYQARQKSAAGSRPD